MAPSPAASTRPPGRRWRLLMLPVALATAAAVIGGPAQGAPPPVPAQGPSSLVVVHATDQAARSRVASLGLDVTPHVTAQGVVTVLGGPADEATLRAAGLSWTVLTPDLAAAERAATAADNRYAATTARSPLPSGRNRYRGYNAYLREMRALAAAHPSLVRMITLKNRTGQGRPVYALEITSNVNQLNDGKPVFLLTGAHHAREWPSAEIPMEYAYDLVAGYANPAADPRLRAAVKGSRTIIVPVVNVDGFIVSRGAEPLGDFTLFDYEMKRKECSVSAVTPAEFTGGNCADNPAGRLRGTDPNRNYPGFWGGPGAGTYWGSDTYRGDAPGDLPEIDNIRALMSSRPVVASLSAHTYSNLVLRPPGTVATGLTPDEPAYQALGQTMATATGYANQWSFQLYDTTGGMEDWSYWNTGALGFTLEIGPDGFHPPFADAVVAEYLGLAPAAGAGRGGVREALLSMSSATLDPSLHSTITGWAPAGHTLTVAKRFITATSSVIDENGAPGPMRYYEDNLSASYSTRTAGRFNWAVNPSTRPLVVGRYGRDPMAPAQQSIVLSNPDGVPAEGDAEQTTFTIEGMPQADNGKATITVGWPGAPGDEGLDWDVLVYGPDGGLAGSSETLNQPEVVTLIDPVPGEYTVVVANYAGGSPETDWTGAVDFASPTPATYSGLTESWSLTCRNAGGRVVSSTEVTVARGETVDLGRRACARKG